MAKESMNIAGADDSQRDADAKGYKTTVDMVTGGSSKDIDSMTGPEVCAPYGKDPLGKSKS